MSAPVLTLVLILTGGAVAAAGGAQRPAMVRAHELKNAVSAYVCSSAAPGEEREIHFRTVPDSVPVSAAGYSLRVIPAGSRGKSGFCSFTVDVLRRNVVEAHLTVAAVVRTYETLLVATRHLGRHEEVSAADVRPVRIETTTLHRPVVPSIDALAGTRTTRVISEGAVLYANAVEPLPLVYQGDPVTVQVLSGRVTLSLQGIAQGDGWEGDRVLVRTSLARERVEGRVLRERTVVIRLR
jgi:flagella basal body P-ring formation protein FlgA